MRFFSVVITINCQVIRFCIVIFVDDDQVHVVANFATFIKLLMVGIQLVDVNVIDTAAKLANVG